MKITVQSVGLKPYPVKVEKVPVLDHGRVIGHVVVTSDGQFAAIRYGPSGKELFVRMGTSVDDAANAILDGHHEEEQP